MIEFVKLFLSDEFFLHIEVFTNSKRLSSDSTACENPIRMGDFILFPEFCIPIASNEIHIQPA